MTLTQLRSFLAIADIGNMTRAAERLHVAQPALSKTLANLEQELGVALFDRQGRRLQLNAFGKVLLERSKRVFSELEQAKQQLTDMASNNAGHVTVGVTTSQILPNIFVDYLSQHTNVKFKLFQVAGRYEIARQLRDGVFDLCITSLPITQLSGNNTVAERELFTEELFLAVRTDHPLAKRQQVALSEVAQEKFLSYPREDGFREITDNFCRQAGFRANVIFESFDTAVIADLVRAGAGVAILPRLWWDVGNSQQLVKLPISCPHLKRSILLSWMENRYLSPTARNFGDFVSQYLQNKRSQHSCE
jgi:DNA-binding transcriptional LysR family regulator